MKSFNFSVFTTTILLLASCAGPNPNPGERVSDVSREKGQYDRALQYTIPKANEGYPWAQLRLGFMYEQGLGVPKDTEKAIEWYKKAAAQKAEGSWAEGLMVGATGTSGFFNQNSDARLAQYKLANLYLKRNKGRDIIDAYINIKVVRDEANDQDIFFCCEFSGGYSVTASEIEKTYGAVLSEISPKQKTAAEKELSGIKLIIRN